MNNRATDTRFNPVTILLGTVSFLLTIIIGVISYAVSQKDKFDDRLYEKVTGIETELQYQNSNSQAHLSEFVQWKTNMTIMQKDVSTVKSTVGELKRRQDKYWPPGDH